MTPRPRPLRFTASGPQSVKEATQLIDPDIVPFPWDLPPKNSKHVYQPNSIVAPANATQAVVTSYQVPDGFLFVLKKRLNVLTGSAFVPGSGDVVWTTDVNSPIGVTAAQSFPVQGLQSETFNVGSFDHGPVDWEGRTVFQPNDIIRVKVETFNNSVVPGAPNYFTSILVGWIFPIPRI